MDEELLWGSLCREMKRVGVSPETRKQSALFSAAKELLVELIWKGRCAEKQTHPQGKASVGFSLKYRGTAVLLVLLQDEHLSDVNSQQNLASPWLWGGSLLQKRQGAVE